MIKHLWMWLGKPGEYLWRIPALRPTRQYEEMRRDWTILVSVERTRLLGRLINITLPVSEITILFSGVKSYKEEDMAIKRRAFDVHFESVKFLKTNRP